MELTLREKIGQRLVVGFPGTTIDNDLKELIEDYKIANIILFKHNIEDSSQLTKLCDQLQELVKKHTGKSAFITIDQEGGVVTRLGRDCVNIPGAMAVAATGKIENAYLAGKITGEQLRALGVNFNLAPVMDINVNMNNPVIGVRSYGDHPDQVADYGIAMTKGLLEGGVMAAAKHFPGHGDTHVDSHVGLPQIEKSIEELEACELIPFIRAIEAKIPAIMTSHILFPQIEKEHLPATMSRTIITDLLKKKLGFEGLVISDCMEMQAIQKYYGTVQGVKSAMLAGVDLVFISHTARLAREASDVLVKALEEGELSIEETNQSVEKVLEWKERYANKADVKTDIDVEKGKALVSQMIKESITAVQMPTQKLPELGDNPLFLGSLPFRSTYVSNDCDESISFPKFMEKRFGGRGIIISANPTEEEADEVLLGAGSHSSIVVGTYNGHLFTGQLSLVNKAAILNKNMIVIALRNPYDLKALPSGVYGIAAYEYTVECFHVLADLIEKPYELEARMPVQMKQYVAGWDGGGTKTAVQIRDLTGNMIYNGSFGPLNYNSQKEEYITVTIQTIIEKMEKIAGSLDAYKSVCISTAGLSNEKAESFIRDEVTKAGISCNLTIIGDHEAVLVKANKTSEGAVLVSGTGSICYGVNEKGQSHRTGGWGHLIDDEGSGYAIGRDILSAAIRSYDKRGDHTGDEKQTLYRLVLDKIGGTKIEDIIHYTYKPNSTKKDIAELAPLLLIALNEQDEAAMRICEKASCELVSLVRPVVEELGLEKGELILSGGILMYYDPIRQQVVAKLAQQFPFLKIRLNTSDNVSSATEIALMSAEQ